MYPESNCFPQTTLPARAKHHHLLPVWLSQLPKWSPDLKQFLSLSCSISSERLPSSPPRFLLAACRILEACQFSSVQFSHSVVSNSLWPRGRQHTRPPCPSPTPGVYPNSCPLSQWCHPAISSSVVPFSSHLQSFPASGSFQMTFSSQQANSVVACGI